MQNLDSVESVSWKLNEFLRGFQNEKPMLPFICEELGGLLRWCLDKFVLKDVLAKADSVKKLIKIDVEDSNMLKPDKFINIGYAAIEVVMKYMEKSDKPSNLSHVHHFYKQAKKMLQKICTHFMSKSPLKIAVVRLAVCFDTKFMASYPDIARDKFSLLLQKLHAQKRLPSSNFAETCKVQQIYVRSCSC